MINYTGLFTYENFKGYILNYLEHTDNNIQWHGISTEILDSLLEINIHPLKIEENKLICLGKTPDNKKEEPIVIDLENTTLSDYIEDYLHNNFVGIKTNILRVFDIESLYFIKFIRYDHSINFIDLAVIEGDNYRSILNNEPIDVHHIETLLPLSQILNYPKEYYNE